MNLSRIKSFALDHWEAILLVSLIVISLVLRFYNFPFRYGLGDEPVRDAAVAIESVRQVQIPLTGPFSSAGQFTFGPWYYYQLIMARALLPIAYSPWIFLTFASVVCIFLLYKIGNFFGKGLGLLLAFLGAISPSLILSGTHLTNPNLSNLFAFLSVYLFLRLIKKDKSLKTSIAFGLSLGIAINIHYQMMGLLILPVLFALLNYKKYKQILLIGFGLFIAFIPLLIFDLLNHWFNFSHIFYYYTEGKNLIYVPNRWLFYVRDFWPSYIEEVTGFPPLAGIIGALLFIAVTALSIYQRKITKPMVLLLVAFAVNFLLLRYYWGERFFGYLNYIRPFVILFEGYLLYALVQFIPARKIKVLVFSGIVVVILAINAPKVGQLFEKDKFSISVHEAKQELYSNYPNEKFDLYICPGPGNTYYSSRSHSLVFLLDDEKMLSEKGKPVAYFNSDCYPTGIDNVEEANFVRIKNTDLVDLSYHTTASISAMKWQRHSLRLISDTTTRWWFNEQP